MRIILLLALFHSNSFGKTSILNFNTMCDLCTGSKLKEYPKRIKVFQDLIRIYKPDLMSLQEFRTVAQIKEVLKPFPQYNYIATENWAMSYADPAIIYDKNRYDLKSERNYWLGPKNDGSFSFGWKWALPRQLLVSKFYDKKYKLEFYFLSAHFDNRRENLTGAAKLTNNIIKELDAPIIFAADTNITTDTKYYRTLTHSTLINTFDIKKELSLVGKYKNDIELCYYRKGKKFPECRVDHVFFSKNAPWKVEDFIVDTLRMPNGKFPSDHRPVVVKIQLKK